MESTETATVDLKQHAAKFGLILGAISVLCTIIIYVVDFSIMANWKFSLGLLLVSLGYTIYGGINYRGQIGGYMPYGKAWLHGFILLAASGLLSTLFGLLLYQVIDPNLPDAMVKAIMESTEQMMRSMGAPEDRIDTVLAQQQIEMPDRFTVVGQLKGYFYLLITFAVVSVITSLFVRKNEPVEM